MMRSKSVARNTLVVGAILVLAKVLSYFSEALIAFRVGTSRISDGYYTITSVHSVLYPMISVGIWRVFMPSYRACLTKGLTKKAKEMADWFTTVLLCTVILIILIMFLFMPIVIHLIAPGFDLETRALATDLVRISLISYIFTIFTACLSVVLQSNEYFFASQIRRVVSYIPTMLYSVFLYGKFGVYGLAFAFVGDSILRFLITAYYSKKIYVLSFSFRKPSNEEIEMLRLLPPAFASAACNELQSFVDRMMASTLEIGTVSGLNYGRKLFSVFNGLLSDAIATAIYPQFISMAEKREEEKYRETVITVASIILFITIPVATVCFFFRTTIVTSVFERGAFDVHSTMITTGAFGYYILGLPFSALNTIVVDVLYSYRETSKVMKYTLIVTACNVGLNILLISPFKIEGLAMATSISALVYYILISNGIERYMPGVSRKMFVVIVKLAFAALISGTVAFAFTLLLKTNWMLMAGLFVAFLVFYALIAHFLGITVVKDLLIKLVAMINKKGKG